MSYKPLKNEFKVRTSRIQCYSNHITFSFAFHEFPYKHKLLGLYFFSITLYSVQGTQGEPGNLLLTHPVPVHTFNRILETLCVKWRNPTLRIDSTPDGRKKIFNISFPRVGIEPATCYSHTPLVPLRRDFKRNASRIRWKMGSGVLSWSCNTSIPLPTFLCGIQREAENIQQLKKS